MKILFIGGTGIISSACTALAIEQGHDLYLLNRGQSTRPTPDGVKTLTADIRDPQSVVTALGDHKFDAVVNWIAFTPDHIETDITLFRERTNQYVFISSASAYKKPVETLPITEGTLLANPFWEYSRNKIACEERLIDAYRNEGFPTTIVRPSHTYDERLLPFEGGYTVLNRMLQGKKVVVHGDGTSLWVLTHNTDFAVGFNGLLGNPKAVGEVFHITSDQLLTWNEIFNTIAQAAGVEPNIVHVPSDLINHFDSGWGDGLLGDKAHSVIFDNSKIKRVVPAFNAKVPFSQGAREMVAYYMGDTARQVVNTELDALIDRIIAAYEQAFEG